MLIMLDGLKKLGLKFLVISVFPISIHAASESLSAPEIKSCQQVLALPPEVELSLQVRAE